MADADDPRRRRSLEDRITELEQRVDQLEEWSREDKAEIEKLRKEIKTPRRRRAVRR